MRARGFTLLELLVVLVILALVGSVVTPPLLRLVDSLGEQGRRDSIVRYLHALPVQTMRAGRPFTLAETAGYVPVPEALDSPPDDLEGVRVWIPRGIVYRSNGACSGGLTHWELPGSRRLTLELAAPLCRLRLRT